MNEWLESQLNAGLPALRGSTVSGTLAVNQELLNELLSSWLAAQAQTQAPAASAAPADISRLLPFLRQAAIRAEAGTLLLDFHISV